MWTVGSRILSKPGAENKQTAEAQEAEARALDSVPFIPQENHQPVFNAPWQAQAFAMALTLHEQGVFEWSEWAAVLSVEIKNAQRNGDADLGDTYYLHWLAALESIVVKKGIAEPSRLKSLYQAWDAAARATPHGQPITLEGRLKK